MIPIRPETLAFRAARGVSDADAALDGAVRKIVDTVNAPTLAEQATLLGVKASSLQCWMEQMQERVPALVQSGLTIQSAIARAHTELQASIMEFLEGKTERAKRARRIIAAETWRRARAIEDSRRAARDVLADDI